MKNSSTLTLLEKSEEPTKFILVGISGIFVNYFILFITAILLGIKDEIALAVSIIISMSTNYSLNRIWTFQSTKKILPEYLKYIGSNIIGGILQWTMTILILKTVEINEIVLVDGIIKIPFLFIANAVGIGVGFISNYILAKFMVF